MRRFILTGAPGSGKTAIIRQLELDGFSVVEEAATDVHALEQARGVAEPWKHPSFIDAIAELQRRREVRGTRETDEVQFHDRSVICTAALAAWLGYPLSDRLSRELKRVETEAIYQKRVFFVQNLGFITPTQARRISFEDTLRFERVHQETYRSFGFELLPIAPEACWTEWMRSSAPPGRRKAAKRLTDRAPSEAAQRACRTGLELTARSGGVDRTSYQLATESLAFGGGGNPAGPR
jgi:predicted ATPase